MTVIRITWYFDEHLIKDGTLEVKYPYFNEMLEVDTVIGGYASEAKEAVNYFRSHKVSDISQCPGRRKFIHH
jgi:hypothetical protein